MDYIGSAVDEEGNVIFSDYLKYEGSSEGWKAFAGRELKLNMKDGSVKVIKDDWWDNGNYPKHGKFINIGGDTLEGMQKCFVFSAMNININFFAKLLDEYLSRDKIYKYDELKEWCNLQYTWYPLIIGGKRYPFRINKRGQVVTDEEKKRVYTNNNTIIVKRKKNKEFYLRIFKLKYNNGERLVKIQRKLMDVLKESLPFSEEEIIKNCNLEV